MINFIWQFFYFLQRKFIKWLLHRLTGSCELLRIVESKDLTLNKTKYIENSLKLSKCPSLHNFLQRIKNSSIEAFAKEINDIKQIKSFYKFEHTIQPFLYRIYMYDELVRKVEIERKTKYSTSNSSHKELLLQLWDNLKPDEKLTSTQCKQWQKIGFQGNDPSTDFRGMGLLGLSCLVYFSSKYASKSKQLLSHSYHPKYGYFFAVVGINLTSVAYKLLINGDLKECLYAIHNDWDEGIFHQIFSYIFVQFDAYWIASKPNSIMEFEERKKSFTGEIEIKLKQGSFKLEEINEAT